MPQIASGLPVLIVAGLLVGFGSVWGNGCTSGHGICGLRRTRHASPASGSIAAPPSLACARAAPSRAGKYERPSRSRTGSPRCLASNGMMTLSTVQHRFRLLRRQRRSPPAPRPAPAWTGASRKPPVAERTVTRPSPWLGSARRAGQKDGEARKQAAPETPEQARRRDSMGHSFFKLCGAGAAGRSERLPAAVCLRRGPAICSPANSGVEQIGRSRP
ncbi:hypothetical protein BTHI11S_04486 [Bosea thiooxidans]